MDVLPDDPGAKLAKPKTFDAEPFRSTIIRILETNSGKTFCMSSVYDVLEEKFIENGDYEKLPGNQQTLRNYIHYLEDSGQINREPEHRRIYDYVFDTPPGEQMLIDFGEETLSKTTHIHFMCLLLRYSRFLCVYAQDEYSGQFYAAIPEVGNRRSDIKETYIPEPQKPWFLSL